MALLRLFFSLRSVLLALMKKINAMTAARATSNGINVLFFIIESSILYLLDFMIGSIIT